jgi:hypothetical protein
MGSPKSKSYTYFVLFLGLLTSVGLVLSCGGGSSTTTTATTGTVNTSLADPPSPNFSADFDHVYVTITKITANISSSASANDSGWQTLADFTSSPKQVDLPSLKADQTCLLSKFASETLPAGKYQQIRLYLLANNASTPPANNMCGGAGFNCVVAKNQSGQDLPPQMLLLSSEAQTGIKIPSSQITSGGLTVESGQAVDLVINFSAEQSLVHEGNGQWRLKPVLHAGEIATTNNALSGTVVDSASTNPIAGAVVYLEQPDTSNPNKDIVVDSAETDANGNFSFCPLEMGATYDIVVTAMTGGVTPVTYNATVTLGVPVGTSLGNIPMIAEPLQVGTTTTTSTPATILGQVTTTVHSTTTGATAADTTAATVTLTPLQDVGNNKMVTVPPFSNMPESLNFTTAASPTVDNGTSPTACPTGTDCENYQLVLPASNPSVWTFASGQATAYSTPAANPALYWVEADAVLPSDTATADCTPSTYPTAFTAGAPPTGTQTAVDPAPLPDNKVTLNFDFVGCTAAP